MSNSLHCNCPFESETSCGNWKLKASSTYSYTKSWSREVNDRICNSNGEKNLRRHLLSKIGTCISIYESLLSRKNCIGFIQRTCTYLMPIFDVLRPIWSKNRFSLFCNNVIATFCYSNLKAEAAAENDDDKAAKDCLCDDDGGNVDCHKIPLVSRFIVSFAFCLWVSLIQLIFSRFEHHLLLLFLLFRLEV